MSLSNKLSIEDVDLKGKRVLIRVRLTPEVEARFLELTRACAGRLQRPP